MSKTKAAAKVTSAPENSSGNQQAKSTTQDTDSTIPVLSIRILYQGTCPKLTTRGRGDLTYELGIDEATDNAYVRIVANVSSGAFSNEWLGLSHIRTLLDIKIEQQKPFSAVAMESLFTRRSANNYGYLAAILKSEGVLTVLPGKPVLLRMGAWEPIAGKITSLKNQGVSLTDHLAILAKEKAEKKAQLMSNLRSTKSTNPTKKTNDIPVQDVPIESTPEQATD